MLHGIAAGSQPALHYHGQERGEQAHQARNQYERPPLYAVTESGEPAAYQPVGQGSGNHKGYQSIGKEGGSEAAANRRSGASGPLARSHLALPLLDEVGAHGHQPQHADEDSHQGKERHDGAHLLFLGKTFPHLLHQIGMSVEVGNMPLEHLEIHFIYPVESFPLIALNTNQKNQTKA